MALSSWLQCVGKHIRSGSPWLCWSRRLLCRGWFASNYQRRQRRRVLSCQSWRKIWKKPISVLILSVRDFNCEIIWRFEFSVMFASSSPKTVRSATYPPLWWLKSQFHKFDCFSSRIRSAIWLWTTFSRFHRRWLLLLPPLPPPTWLCSSKRRKAAFTSFGTWAQMNLWARSAVAWPSDGLTLVQLSTTSLTPLYGQPSRPTQMPRMSFWTALLSLEPLTTRVQL